MRIFGREIEGIPKLIVVFAAILLVSSGLCGLQFVYENSVPSGIGGLFIVAGIVELGLMVVSAGGIVVFSAIWVVQSIYEQFAGPPEEQSLRIFKDDEDGPGDRGED
jgi:hypothetical protein